MPPRPERIGDLWIEHHQGGHTLTGYTSWSTDRSIAEAAAEAKSEKQGLSGRIVIFRVRVDSLSKTRIFPGREDEDEFLIQGTVEEISISKSASDDEENENG
jgi:hypothetical protein